MSAGPISHRLALAQNDEQREVVQEADKLLRSIWDALNMASENDAGLGLATVRRLRDEISNFGPIS